MRAGTDRNEARGAAYAAQVITSLCPCGQGWLSLGAYRTVFQAGVEGMGKVKHAPAFVCLGGAGTFMPRYAQPLGVKDECNVLVKLGVWWGCEPGVWF